MQRIALLLASAVVVILVACGGDDATDSALLSPSASVAPSTSASATAVGSETAIPAPSETVTSTYFIPTSELPRVRFQGAAGPVELPVEVPARSEYSIGLSGRTTLEGRGMVFYREDFGQTNFWMRNTHIDLDIAFVDADGEILFITTMTADTDDLHGPGSPYVAAIEATAGWYAEQGIEVGDTVEYLFDLEATVTD